MLGRIRTDFEQVTPVTRIISSVTRQGDREPVAGITLQAHAVARSVDEPYSTGEFGVSLFSGGVTNGKRSDLLSPSQQVIGDLVDAL